MKRALALVLAVAMLCLLLPTFGVIANAEEYDKRTDPTYLAKYIYKNLDPGDNAVLKEGMNLYKSGDDIGALKCFRNNFIEKYRKVPRSYYPGLTANERISFVADVVCGKSSLSEYQSAYPNDKALDDCLGAFGSPYVDRKINWNGSHGKTTTGGITFYDNGQGEAALVFIGVMGAAYYRSGGDKIYIDKFFQVMDDFAVNAKRDIEAYEAVTPPISGSSRDKFTFTWSGWHMNNQRCAFLDYALMQFCKLLPDEGETEMPHLSSWDEIATPRGKANPDYYDLIDPVKLATYAVCMQEDIMPTLQACYTNSNFTKNMQDAAVGCTMRQLAYFSEFTNLSRMRDTATEYVSNIQTDIYQDGSMIEQSWNYNKDSRNAYDGIFSTYVELGVPLPERAEYVRNLLTYNTRLVDATTSVALTPMRIGGGAPNLRMPEIWTDDELLDEYKKEQGYEHDIDTPLFDSVFFPYGGYACLRSGWDLKEDMTLSTFISNNAGMGHSSYIKNGVWLSAFGRPLIMSGDSEVYTVDTLPEDERDEYNEWNAYFNGKSTKKGSTVLVNGKNQLGKAATKANEVPILDSLFLDGEHFDYIEGNFDQGYDGIGEAVSHNRQNFFVRDAGLWIITDTMNNMGSSSNEYSQIWRFPARVDPEEAKEQGKTGLVSPQGYTLTGFRDEEVIVDTDNHAIKTQDEGTVNIFLSQFSNEELSYKKYFGSKGDEPDGDGLYRGWTTNTLNSSRVPCADVYVSWRDNNSNQSQVMTFAMPSKTDQAPYKELKDISSAEQGITGFEVITDEGIKVTSLSAPTATPMEAGGISAVATDLILCDKDGEISGIVLGCESLQNETGKVETEEKNFEFVIKDGKPEIIQSLIQPHSFGWVETDDGKYYPRYDAFTNEETTDFLQSFTSPTDSMHVIKYSDSGYIVSKIQADLNKVIQLYPQLENVLLSADKAAAVNSIEQYRAKIMEIAAFYNKGDFNKAVAEHFRSFADEIKTLAPDGKDEQINELSSCYLASANALLDNKYDISDYLGAIDSANNSGFTDIANSWAKAEIEYMAKQGLVNGVSASKFDPQSNMTRAQVIAILMRILGQEGEYKGEFTDVSADDWCASGIAAAAEKGIVTGDGGLFRPNDPITREEIAKIISLALGLTAEAPAGYTDSDNISDWASEFVSAVSGSSLMNGYPDGSFQPKANITRAEATVLLKRVYEKN